VLKDNKAFNLLRKELGMSDKVLCVDDDANILAGYRRQLHRQFNLDTASSAAEGLKTLSERGPFAVVVLTRSHAPAWECLFRRSASRVER